MRAILILAAAFGLAACGDPDAGRVQGYLAAQGHSSVQAHWTEGDRSMDRRACGDDGTLYAWVSDKGAGVMCSGSGKVWAPR